MEIIAPFKLLWKSNFFYTRNIVYQKVACVAIICIISMFNYRAIFLLNTFLVSMYFEFLLCDRLGLKFQAPHDIPGFGGCCKVKQPNNFIFLGFLAFGILSWWVCTPGVANMSWSRSPCQSFILDYAQCKRWTWTQRWERTTYIFKWIGTKSGIMPARSCCWMNQEILSQASTCNENINVFIESS